MATLRTKSYLLTRFEAGDRPTDVDFADLFQAALETLLFLVSVFW